jgi:hypothetical protein
MNEDGGRTEEALENAYIRDVFVLCRFFGEACIRSSLWCLGYGG